MLGSEKEIAYFTAQPILINVDLPEVIDILLNLCCEFLFAIFLNEHRQPDVQADALRQEQKTLGAAEHGGGNCVASGRSPR